MYGSRSNPRKPWSIKFSHYRVKQWKFSTGNGKYWMIMDNDQVMGWYANQDRWIRSSSIRKEPHKAKQYRRRGSKEDPWLSMQDHPQMILYGEASWGGPTTPHTKLLRSNGGAYVYILTTGAAPTRSRGKSKEFSYANYQKCTWSRAVAKKPEICETYIGYFRYRKKYGLGMLRNNLSGDYEKGQFKDDKFVSG